MAEPRYSTHVLAHEEGPVIICRNVLISGVGHCRRLIEKGDTQQVWVYRFDMDPDDALARYDELLAQVIRVGVDGATQHG